MLAPYLADVTDREGLISPQRVSETLRVTFAHLARLAKVHRNTLAQHPESPAVQARLGEVARVIATAADLLGGDTGRAIVWFRHQPLAGFDGQTAEELVADGHTDAVLAHLETLRDGGYA
jgi:uncharacterized protein (DUF2384 family)